MQAFNCLESPYMNLYDIIETYTKIIALFFGYLADFLYLCTIKHVQLLKLMFNGQCSIFNGQNGARPTLFPLHSATLSLAKTQIPAV